MANLYELARAWLPGSDQRQRPSTSPPQSPPVRGSPADPSPLNSPHFTADLGQSLGFDGGARGGGALVSSTLRRRQSALLRQLASVGADDVAADADDVADIADEDAVVRDLTAPPSPQDILAAAREDGGSKAAQVMDACGESMPIPIDPGLVQGKGPERLASEHETHAAYNFGSAAAGKCACFGTAVVCPRPVIAASTGNTSASSTRFQSARRPSARRRA